MRFSTRLFVLIIVTLFIISSAGISATAAEKLPGEGRKLTLAYGSWIGEHLPDQIIKILFEEKLGYEEVKISTMGVPMVYKGIESGEVDLYASCWLPNQKVQFNENREIIEIVGTLYEKARQGWLVPTWFSEKYDVTSITDLKRDKIAEMLDITSDGKGDIMGGPSGWLATEINNKKIEEYGLSNKYKQVIGQSTMLNYRIQNALKNKKPVLFYGYTPDWFFAQYPIPEEVTWLEDPYGYWPPDDEMDTGKLGWPPNAAHIIAYKSFSEEHPAAAKVLERFKLDIAEVNRSIFLQTVEEKTSAEELESHARKWISENEEKVEKMLQGIDE